MTLTHLFAQTALIERYTVDAKDEYGNEEVTWTAVATVACRIENFSGFEQRQGRSVNFSAWRMFVEADTDITTDDRVTDVATGRLMNVVTVEPVYSDVALHHKVVWLDVWEG